MYNKNQSLSYERIDFLKKKKNKKILIISSQISILIIFIIIWELLASFNIIDSFITSSPSRIISTLINMSNYNFLYHIYITTYETIIGFLLGTIFGTGIAILLWYSPFLSKVLEPYLVILNSLPKIALGPIIIIWVGAGTSSIIVMALSISLIVTILEMLNGFLNTDQEKIKMLNTFGAKRYQIFTKIIFPYNLHTLFNSLKINIGLSLVGVIAGEFLVSKAGLGYLIVYGGQVFKLDLVMTSVLILSLLAAILYQMVKYIENIVLKIVHFK